MLWSSYNQSSIRASKALNLAFSVLSITIARGAAKLVSWLRLQSKRGAATRGRVAATKEGRSVGRKMAASQQGEEMVVAGGSGSGGEEEGGYRDVAWCRQRGDEGEEDGS
ncbi:hypothetical protein B296_00019152 [Ensete ventricosum]|uniref:Uncharacterized protein n=1 Tax=Ensete ventricosum TaxID=4639 RepID=A0A426YMI8_ENSVE|nr:hypothetical protein B296_00019152 [Ensete ventricosum]